MPMFSGAFFLLVLFFFCPSAGAGVLAPDLEAALKGAEPGESFAVIVSFGTQGSVTALARDAAPAGRGEVVRALKGRAEGSQQRVRALLEGRKKEFRPLWIINSLALSADEALIRRLAEEPEVNEIRFNRTVSVPEVRPAQLSPPEWNLLAIRIPELWEMGFTGSGVTVAIIDSGVDGSHPDLGPRWRGGEGDWFNPYAQRCGTTLSNCTGCEQSASFPCDDVTGADRGHGTAVAGIILGGSSRGIPVGVAPDARWIAAKIFRDDGTASVDVIHEAFQWVLQRPEAPMVVNNSWGLGPEGGCHTEFQGVIDTLRAAGIVVVAAAGNSGPALNTGLSPGNYPQTLSAAAVNGSFRLADFSSRGPAGCGGQVFPEVAAPGVGIRTFRVSEEGDEPVFLSGTSFSAAHLSGIVALLRQAFPEAPLADIEEAVSASAADLGPEGADDGYGFGLVDALAAWRRLNGEPHVGIYDPLPPENDRRFTFGTMAPGETMVQDLVLYNAGAGGLRIDGIVPAGPGSGAFSVQEDLCSAVTIAPRERCRVTIAFAPDAGGLYSADLLIASNSPQGPVSVALSGEGSANPPPPVLEASPARKLLFGNVGPGRSAERVLTMKNGGQGVLSFGDIDRNGVQPPFSIVSDSCPQPPRALLTGQSCSMTIRFAPSALAPFSSQLTLRTNDPARPEVPVLLEGVGNNPPRAAVLLDPPQRADLRGPTVEFRWRPSTDPDGHPVTETLLVSRSVQFPDNLADSLRGSGRALFAGGGGLFAVFGALALRRGKGKGWGAAMIVAGIFLMSACGGDGQEGGASRSVSGLAPGVTYFWKVVAEDPLGGTSSSEVRTFTVR